LKPENELIESKKRNAALAAVKHVKDNCIVGLGSGSTAAYAICALGNRIRHEKLNLLAVPTSYQAFLLAAELGITITTLEEHPLLDVTIDGADQIDSELNLIKGMGGALAREKIVAATSKQNITIADEKKKVKTLGENNHPVPIEILPFAITTVMKRIERIGGEPFLRESKGKLGPVITDNGNAVVDAVFGTIENAAELEKRLKMIPGVVETGLFVGLSDIAYIGTSSTVEKIQKKRNRYWK
jgi:ribose 5-phosphate isomerase A